MEKITELQSECWKALVDLEIAKAKFDQLKSDLEKAKSELSEPK